MAEQNSGKENAAGITGSLLLVPLFFTLVCRILDSISRVQLILLLDPYLHWLTTWWGQSIELGVAIYLLWQATVLERRREEFGRSQIYRPGGSHGGKIGLPPPPPERKLRWLKFAIIPCGCAVIAGIGVWIALRVHSRSIAAVSPKPHSQQGGQPATPAPPKDHKSPSAQAPKALVIRPPTAQSKAESSIQAIPEQPRVSDVTPPQSSYNPVTGLPTSTQTLPAATADSPLVCPDARTLVEGWILAVGPVDQIPSPNSPINFAVHINDTSTFIHPSLRGKIRFDRRLLRGAQRNEAETFLADVTSYLRSPAVEPTLKSSTNGARLLREVSLTGLESPNLMTSFMDVGPDGEILNQENANVPIQNLSAKSQLLIKQWSTHSLDETNFVCKTAVELLKEEQ